LREEESVEAYPVLIETLGSLSLSDFLIEYWYEPPLAYMRLVYILILVKYSLNVG
jgi:hypothetical protein